MTLLRHELRQGRVSFLIWAASIGCFLGACIFLYPEMEGEMDALGEMFASMGSFTAAFGMERLNIGTMEGYYCVECGVILGLGGALYASQIGIRSLSCEESGGTADFLLTHPVSRGRIVLEKLLSVFLRVLLLNLALLLVSVCCTLWIRVKADWDRLILLHVACLLLQLELAGICFGLSAFLHREGGGIGLGLGLAVLLYILNLLSNITEGAEFLKAVTPFAYCEGADLLEHGALNAPRVLTGMAALLLGVLAAFCRYTRKDII